MRCSMKLITRSLSLVRTWLGLGDPSDDRLTPSHGWLLTDAAEVVARREDDVPAPAPRLP
jgi:hypothetical protein